MGLLVALVILLLWLGHLVYSLLFVELSLLSPWVYIHVLLQAYLYTGLFITGHDAMHGLVSKNRALNDWAGRIACLLFAGLAYRKLRSNHYLHHLYPATEKDPDYYTGSQNFWLWWLVFLKRYLTIGQMIFMAVAFNVLKLWIPGSVLVVFWIVPSVLATFQLFFFGTYLPHRQPHTVTMEPHYARTQRGPHWWAMLSCYFFGYHWEHHEIPQTPWWQLYRLKNSKLAPDHE